MQQFNVHEAKTHFSKLLALVASGEEVVIANAGRPVAKVVPITQRTTPRTPGRLAGQIDIAPDFDELPEALAAAFRGEHA